MKKTVAFIIALTTIICLCLGLVSCGHVCVYETEISYDEDFHWFACESKSCSEKIGLREHTMASEFDENGNPMNVCTECGYTTTLVDTAPEHVCSFAEEYSSSTNFHWFACETDGCTKSFGREAHDYSMPEIVQKGNLIIRNYTCSLCGHEDSETTIIESVIKNEAAWSEAFDNLDFVNFTLDIYYYTSHGSTQHNQCIISESGVYYNIPGDVEFYSIKNDDGSYTTYGRSDFRGSTDAPFYKLSDNSSIYADNAKLEVLIKLSFSDYYDMFYYDGSKGAYIYEGEIATTAYTTDGRSFTLYCFNNEIKVADGQISYIKADYRIEDDVISDGERYSLCYSAIGFSEVTIPQSVIKNAKNDPNYKFDYPYSYDN